MKRVTRPEQWPCCAAKKPSKQFVEHRKLHASFMFCPNYGPRLEWGPPLTGGRVPEELAVKWTNTSGGYEMLCVRTFKDF